MSKTSGLIQLEEEGMEEFGESLRFRTEQGMVALTPLISRQKDFSLLLNLSVDEESGKVHTDRIVRFDSDPDQDDIWRYITLPEFFSIIQGDYVLMHHLNSKSNALRGGQDD